MAIVTNCNRNIAEIILEILNIDHFFEFIVIGNECNKPKPYSDPYLKGIELFNGSNNKTIIFEDSKSGLLSAFGVNPKCIVGLETNYSKEELLNYNASVTIKNFLNIDINL